MPATLNLNVTTQQVAPTANADRTIAVSGQVADFDVMANDQDDNDIRNSSISVVTGPSHGTAGPHNGRLRYSPSTTYTGFDLIEYRLTDAGGQMSEAATVTVIVTDPAKPWRNPVDPEDVNLSGNISPTDAIAVINAIGRDVSTLEKHPFPETSELLLVDVDGNGVVNPVDIIRVVNRILGLTPPQSSSPDTAYRLAPSSDLESQVLVGAGIAPHARPDTMSSGLVQSIVVSIDGLPVIPESRSNLRDAYFALAAEEAPADVLDQVPLREWTATSVRDRFFASTAREAGEEIELIELL